MNWVWGQRLEAVHRDLTEGRYRAGLTELAFSWGFSSPAHFSRAFRRQYGYAPSQLRARAGVIFRSRLDQVTRKYGDYAADC